MKNIVFAAVVLLVGSFAHLGVCQNQTERPGVTGLLDCTHRNEAMRMPANLVIEHVEFAPGSGKTTNPETGTDFGQVLSWKSAVINGRRVSVVTRDAGAEGCIVREDWDNTQASEHGPED